jgi:hypothetical protein
MVKRSCTHRALTTLWEVVTQAGVRPAFFYMNVHRVLYSCAANTSVGVPSRILAADILKVRVRLHCTDATWWCSVAWSCFAVCVFCAAFCSATFCRLSSALFR